MLIKIEDRSSARWVRAEDIRGILKQPGGTQVLVLGMHDMWTDEPIDSLANRVNEALEDE